MENVKGLQLATDSTATQGISSYSNYGKALLTVASTITAYALWKMGDYSLWSWGAYANDGEQGDITIVKSPEGTEVSTGPSNVLQNVETTNTDVYSQRRALASLDELSGNQTLPLVSATEIGRFAASTSITDFNIRNNLAYVIDGENVFYVVNVSNPANPQQLGQYNPGAPYHNFNLVGDYAYVAADAAGVQTIDVSDPSNLVLDGTSMVGVNPEAISASHLAAGFERTLVYNNERRKFISHLSSDLLDIYRVYIDTPGVALGVVVSGGTAYIAGGRSGIQIIDVSNPSSPQFLGSYNTPGRAYVVVISGNKETEDLQISG